MTKVKKERRKGAEKGMKEKGGEGRMEDGDMRRVAKGGGEKRMREGVD